MKSLLAAFLLMLAMPASAQTALLRSGDHPDFTRLTLPLPGDTSFALTETPGRAEISFSGSLRAIDPAQVFTRIGRTRLSAVSVAPGPVLALSLACDCPVETTLAANNLLIIDILNGTPLEAADTRSIETQLAQSSSPVSPASLPAAAPRPIPASGGRTARPAPILLRGRSLTLGLQAVDPWLPALPTDMRVSKPTPSAPAPQQSGIASVAVDIPIDTATETPAPDASTTNLPAVSLPSPIARPEAEGLVSALPGVVPLSASEARLTRELEQSLLAAIGNAATEGLLDPGAGANPLNEKQRQISEAHVDGTHPDPGLAATPSTFESDNPDGSGRIVLSGNPCALFMPPLVEVDGMDFIAELTRRRSRLTGERDRDNVEAYHDLAHFYLLYGFGPEAGSVLASVQQPPREAAEMASIARILEYGHDPDETPFTGRMTCDTDAALWAALAPEHIPLGSDFDGKAIKRTLLAMPNELKAVVGPLLADRFLEARETDFARDMLRIIGRNLPDMTQRQALAEAKLASQGGPPDADAFHDLIARNTDVSPEALLHYTNSALEHGQMVDAETIGLLGSYRTQYRAAALAADLTRAEILANAASGNFPKAYELYDENRKVLMPEVQDEVIDALASALAERGTDAIFTKLYFTHASELRDRASAATVNSTAARLILLGLPDVADRMLATDTDESEGRERRILRARAALDMNLPRRAEEHLTGLEGDDVAALRAEAHLANADYAEAETLFSEAGLAEAAADAAWLARNWQSLQQDDEAEKARLATVISTQLDAPVDLPAIGPPTLAASREALTQSGETRSVLQDLLSTLEVDTALKQ